MLNVLSLLRDAFNEIETINSAKPICARALPWLKYFLEITESIINAVYLIRIKLPKKYVNVCCVYPCNPFLDSFDLRIAFSKLKKDKNSLIFPVVEYSHPIERAYEFKNEKFIKRVSNTKKNERTQDYKRKFFDAGKFYLASKDTWINNKSKKKIGIITKWWNAVDIDTPEDWEKAKTIFKIFKKVFLSILIIFHGN